MIEKYESRKIRVAIRHVLVDVWDPIGVKDWPEAQGEYDAYLGDVYELLVTGASDERVEEYLWWVVTERMGLGGPSRKSDITETLRALREIPLPPESK